ncbi:SusC/RagA family TonB-linked outer membrane protein [Bacteroides sp.]|uniref:SusC/RagA family TonB-linked outer membrane protein n=2 Tax=Bacteroides sp. TaxID=29523 RepID=UPI002FCC6103
MDKLLLHSLKCLAVMLCWLSIPQTANSQELSKRITLKQEQATIENLLQAIEKQTQYKFLYRKDLIDTSKRLTYSCSEKVLAEVLNELLPQWGLSYRVKDLTIVLIPGSQQARPAKELIRGTIVDEENVPIIGATVVIKGTADGVITDIDGKFSLEARLDDRLLISYVGRETIERKVGEKVMTVVMKDDAISLSDVVVTGYQKINRKMFTGSASKINADETILKGNPDLTNSLQGKVSGVQISNVSGAFGASPVLTIRGNSSINGTNKPLWVVDGVVLEDLMTVSAEELTSGNLSTLLSSGVAGLNPEDISSFEILKDVSATSLYGAQAMNGVIVITTKQGKKDKLTINYTGSIAMKERPHYRDFNIMDSKDEMYIYKELERKGWIDITTVARSENFGAIGKMYDEIIKGNINWGPNGSLNENFLSTYANSNTDWFGTLFHNSLVNQHSLSFSGGGENTTYYASLSYYNDNGTAVRSDKVDRYTASLRGKFHVSKTFNVGLKLAANIRDQRVPGTKDRSFNAITGEFTRDFDINPFNYALNTSRSMRAYDSNGNLEFFRRSYTDFNILHELNHNFVDLTVRDITAQMDLEYTPIKNLTLMGSFQYRAANTLKEHKIHEYSNQAEAYRANYSQSIIDSNRFLFRNPKMPTSNPYSILPEGGFYNTDESDLRHTYFRATADYSPRLGMDHILNLFAGFEANKVDRKVRANDGWGYLWDKGGVVVTHPDVMDYLKQQGDTYFHYNESRDRRISSFINTAYSYQGKYVFNAGLRYDGSNQLGSSREARYLPSWNVSAAWNMHEEPFMRTLSKVVNVLKPKISYGYNGIMGPSTSAELTIYARQTLRPTDNEVYNSIESLQNKDLTWEKMYELNLGFEAAILNNRVVVDFAHYRRKSIDLIDYVSTSAIGGQAIKLGNIGNMKSYGYEFSINTLNISTKDFDWRTNLNINFHKSEITKLNNFSRISTAISNTGTAMLGYPQRGLFSVRFSGLDKEGIPTFYGENNQLVYDMNLQSRQDIDKILKYEGPLEPKVYGGLSNAFRYKNWNLSVGLVYKFGSVIRLDDQFYPFYNDYSAFPKELKNRWIQAGDEKLTSIPAILDKRTYERIEGQQTYQMYNKSTERVAKGDFIRLKDLSVGYKFPRMWLKGTSINQLNLSFQATNLWLIYSDSKLSGIDPEFYLSGGVSSPVSRMYTFTLNLTF